MNSCIYEGYTEHRRHRPVEHHFRYPLYVYCLDLDELQDLDHRLPFFGYNRLRPSSIYDRDYLNERGGSIRQKLMIILAEKPFYGRINRIVLITSARYFHYVFNPVSFYYCFARDDSLLCVIAEVNNTFGEKHLYVLDDPEPHINGYEAHYRTEKAFHVSPFNTLIGEYEFFFSGIGKEIDIRIFLHREGEKIFEARLWGVFRPLTAMGHVAMLLRHPFIPHLSMPRIFYEAARLSVRKKLPYFDKPIAVNPLTIRMKPPGAFQKLCIRIIQGLFEKMTRGVLHMRLPDKRVWEFGGVEASLRAEMIVHDYRFFSRVVLGGDVGLGEAYADGMWDTPDIPALFRVLIRNRDILENGYPATAWIKRRKNDVMHLLRANTPSGARRNIRQHYDLSNDFFRLFLDETMTYSCGIYRSDSDTLEEAQRNKLQSMIDKARIVSSDEVLEIGCGWGGFAIEAAKRTGCRVTGITISAAQHELAAGRISEENLQDRITVLLRDYRFMDGAFDKIVSIEMLEAVGERYFGTYFACCDRLLRPGGRLVIQVITIPDQRYSEYRKETDWIQKHIFPGGLLPSLTVLTAAATGHSSLLMESMEDIGPNYARTLKDWRERFVKNLDRVRVMGFDRSFQRKWVYYLATCEAGFAERALGNLQIVFRKPT